MTRAFNPPDRCPYCWSYDVENPPVVLDYSATSTAPVSPIYRYRCNACGKTWMVQRIEHTTIVNTFR